MYHTIHIDGELIYVIHNNVIIKTMFTISTYLVGDFLDVDNYKNIVDREIYNFRSYDTIGGVLADNPSLVFK